MYAKPVMVGLCALLVMPGPVDARRAPDQLTVVASDQSAQTYDQWTDRAAHRLSRNIQNASSLYRDAGSTGYSRVQFRLDQEGRPQNIELAGPSSSRSIDRISTRAIKAMGSLFPLPREIGPNRKFEAWIIVANDVTDREKMLSALRSQHRTEIMAQAVKDRPVLIAQR
ncbi:energy transducer TonB [Sphingobium sp. ZW T5_29]|uniref:energy transducer TonB n=1 Tax=Sphingobium sp. ZW T5_29 TaxID=3378077 RepID=UPI003853189E